MDEYSMREVSYAPARVLLVDDEPALLRAFRRILTTARPEWSIRCARNGIEALKQLEQEPIDVVVLDLQMPEMDGQTLIEHMLRLYPTIARIVHSSHSHLLADGQADVVVPKPATPAEMLSVIDAAVQSSGRGSGEDRTGQAVCA